MRNIYEPERDDHEAINQAIIDNDFERFKNMKLCDNFCDTHFEWMFELERTQFIDFILSKEIYDKEFPLEEYFR